MTTQPTNTIPSILAQRLAAKLPYPYSETAKPKKLSIGQQVRITSYEHVHCGEFGRVISVHADGKAAIVNLLRFPGRMVGVCIEQVILAQPMPA